MSENPLVSVCTTFFSAERYIHRVLESSLHQTYKNVEVVIVDDASVDGSEKIIREYAKRDPRVKYFRNAKRENLALSLARMFKLAKGDFVTMVGADDWLARDYIENGVRSFREHPDAAGVIPKLISLSEAGNDKFEFKNEEFDAFSPSKTYPSEWFVRRMYRSTHLYVSALAMVRKKDAVSAMEYFIRNYCQNPSASISAEMRDSFFRGFGIDTMLFLEILTRYKEFVFDSSLNHIKTWGGQTVRFNFERSSLAEILKDVRYYMFTFKYIYEPKWTRFYRGMKIFLAAEALSSALIYFFRCGFRPSFLDVSGDKEGIKNFLGEFSPFEILTVVLHAILKVMRRSVEFTGKALVRKSNPIKRDSRVFTPRNFLDSNGNFVIN